MYRLVLRLPLDVTLVHKIEYETIQDAAKASTLLPGNFEVEEESSIDMDTAILVPIKQPVKT